jgi:hypothetical protein
VTQEPRPEPDPAREALAELHDSLDSARRLVERTRFLLGGGAPGGEDDPPLAGEPQAAASPATSDTVQNPSGE